MKSFAILALAGAVAAFPQAVTSKISPTGSAPASCATTYPGTFEISIVNVTSSKRSVQKRTALEITLSNGVLTDASGRTGYIASNNQFQFDNPIQAGAIYTAGWSVCSNGTLALGSSAVFYECLSGTFYNLYDASTGAQCSPIYIDVVGGGSTVSTASDGQATAASASGAISQITDGQIQATTATPVVSQISDGQIQATTGKASSTSVAVVSQISDGQIQATTGKASSTSAKATGAVVSQISDGQIQAATNGTSLTTAKPTVAVFTGAAAMPTVRSEFFGLAAGVLAMAML